MEEYENVTSLPEDMIESYAAVDRIEGEFVVLEVESYSITQNAQVPFSQRMTFMAEVPKFTMLTVVEEIHEGDVVVVKHCPEEVRPIRYAPEEKERRIAFLNSLV